MQKIVKLNQAFLYCCMVVMFCLHSISYAAPTQGKPVSITIKNSTLAEVLRQVSKKSGLYIYFQDADLAAHKNVTIDVRNKPVENVLHELLDGRGLSWVEVSENTIAVKKKLDLEERRIEGDTVATITVTGKVVNEKGEPLPGATIKVKNSNKGTTANNSGSFTITNVISSTYLIITNVSFKSVEIPLNGRTNLEDIVLKESVQTIDEAVVIAYGQTTGRLNPGNVISIKSSEIEKQPINNPLYVLQGQVTGLQVTPTTGLAGGAVNLQIRGRNSLNSLSEPLVVVDGLPVINNIRALGHNDLLQMSTLSFLNPNDIESISVLKDADATSIYGSRGANGVILITTKKGKIGKTSIDINIQNGWGKVPKHIDVLNTEEYLQYRKESYLNRGINYNTAPLTAANADIRYWDSTRNTNWQKELIGNTASYQDAQASISGGSTIVQYLMGGNYHKESTVFPGSTSDTKGGAHLSLTGSSVDQRFKATVTAGYTLDKNTLPGVDFTNSAITLPPNAPSIYKNDILNWELLPSGISSWLNPISELSRSYEATVENLIASTDISYKILPSLNLKLQVGYNSLKGESFRKTNPFAGRPPEANGLDASASFNTNSAKNLSIEPQINYSSSLFNGHLNILIGGSVQSSKRKDQVINAGGFKNDAQLKSLAAADPTKYILNNGSSEYKYAAIFGRISYNLQNKYILNISGRRDGSSRFGPGKQFGNFGSVGAAWLFSDEEFIKSKLKPLSFGKLRFSYGTTGNDGIGDYAYLERYQPIDVNDLYQGSRGYSTLGLFNGDYAWEETKKAEIGLELGFIKDKIFISASYFRNRSNNQLIAAPYPALSGPGTAVVNLPALVQNSGLELILNTENISGKTFSWNTSINFTRNRNKLLSYPDIENTAYYKSIIGEPFFGIETAFKSAGVDPVTGHYQFVTVDGKLTFDPSDFNRIDGGKFLRIYTEPKFYGGITNTFNLGRFTVSVFLQYNRQTSINPYSSYLARSGRVAINVPKQLLDRWKNTDDQAQFQKNGYTPLGDYLKAISNFIGSDWNFVDNSFIRVKNVALSYDVPLINRKRIDAKSLRIYIHAQNLLTFTKYKGLDPETKSMGSLPPLRVITAGIQVSL